MIKIAIPNKGSLSEDSVKIITEAGYRCKRGSSELVVSDPSNGVEFYFLRPRDIAVYVGAGILDIGISGRDLALDSASLVKELLPLNFAHSTFCYAVPKNSNISVSQFEGRRIATSYPKLVERDLSKKNIKASIIKLDGAVEISVRLGIADIIADVVQSGRTLSEAGLAITGEPILESEAILIVRENGPICQNEIDIFINRIKGITVAREFQMVEYDIPKTALDEACSITPGIESPTVSPLSKEGWVAVKSMIRKRDTNKIIDKLAEISAKGIIVTDIRTCRI